MCTATSHFVSDLIVSICLEATMVFKCTLQLPCGSGTDGPKDRACIVLYC